jgi:hypothetical protein
VYRITVKHADGLAGPMRICVEKGHAGEGGDGCDEIGMIGGHAVRHESPIGMSRHIDALPIDRILPGHVLNQTGEIRRIVHRISPVAGGCASQTYPCDASTILTMANLLPNGICPVTLVSVTVNDLLVPGG